MDSQLSKVFLKTAIPTADLFWHFDTCGSVYDFSSISNKCVLFIEDETVNALVQRWFVSLATSCHRSRWLDNQNSLYKPQFLDNCTIKNCMMQDQRISLGTCNLSQCSTSLEYGTLQTPWCFSWAITNLISLFDISVQYWNMCTKTSALLTHVVQCGISQKLQKCILFIEDSTVKRISSTLICAACNFMPSLRVARLSNFPL